MCASTPTSLFVSIISPRVQHSWKPTVPSIHGTWPWRDLKPSLSKIPIHLRVRGMEGYRFSPRSLLATLCGSSWLLKMRSWNCQSHALAPLIFTDQDKWVSSSCDWGLKPAVTRDVAQEYIKQFSASPRSYHFPMSSFTLANISSFMPLFLAQKKVSYEHFTLFY